MRMVPSPHELRPKKVEGNYYQVLGVDFEAPDEEIRRVYHAAMRSLHPDRRRSGSCEAGEHFHQVQAAWRCLSDPTRRFLYDLRNFGRSTVGTGENAERSGFSVEERLLFMQKEQALRDVSNMEVALLRVVRRERAARGVLIRQALYGDLRLKEDRLEEGLAGTRTIVADDLVGPLLDVAMPLQCLVEQHSLVLPGGASSSKADLPGFYNPTPLDTDVELSLYVLYEFRGLLHEVIVGDRETLSVPVRKHAVQPGKASRGPFSPANITSLRHRRTSSKKGARAPAAQPGASGRQPSPSAEAARPWSRPAGDPREALERAWRAYRLERMLAQPGPDDPSKQEFAVLAVGAGLLFAFMAMWAVRSSEHLLRRQL